jgi:hypothetical protein
MYLFNSVSSLSLKLINSDRKCIWSCVGCFESQKIQSMWFKNLDKISEIIDKIQENKLLDVSKIDVINFYGTSIFKLFTFTQISDFLEKYNFIHFKTQVDLNDYDFLDFLSKIEDFSIFKNLKFYLFKSYEDNLDLELLEKYINFLKLHNLSYEVDLSVNNLLNNIDSIKEKLWENINIRKNIIIENNKVENLKWCNLVNSYAVVWKNIVFRNWEYKSLFLDFLPNWDIQVHNLPCHWGAICLSNINKEHKEIIKDFIKFKLFLSKLLWWWEDFWAKCYKCFTALKYNYRKF